MREDLKQQFENIDDNMNKFKEEAEKKIDEYEKFQFLINIICIFSIYL
jgi:hypothetical protein